MSLIKSTKGIGALVMLITLSLASVASVSAQGQYDRNNRWNRSHLTRFAYALGYTRGYDDASDRSHRNYREMQRWREGSEGYEDPMGTRSVFRDNFRRGFARGFMDARSGRNRRFSQSDVDRIREDFAEGRSPRRP
jgi:hypothetical protein